MWQFILRGNEPASCHFILDYRQQQQPLLRNEINKTGGKFLERK
jgi:hypothetical protein